MTAFVATFVLANTTATEQNVNSALLKSPKIAQTALAAKVLKTENFNFLPTARCYIVRSTFLLNQTKSDR